MERTRLAANNAPANHRRPIQPQMSASDIVAKTAAIMDESLGYSAGYRTLPEKRIRRAGLEHGRYLAMMFTVARPWHLMRISRCLCLRSLAMRYRLQRLGTK